VSGCAFSGGVQIDVVLAGSLEPDPCIAIAHFAGSEVGLQAPSCHMHCLLHALVCITPGHNILHECMSVNVLACLLLLYVSRLAAYELPGER
jgi:hypothetical protein